MPKPTTEKDIRLMAKYASMKMDGLALFRPMPMRYSQQEACVRSRCRKKLIRGGNRAGKSVIAAAIFASIARDKPILIEKEDGTVEEVHCRLPHQRGKPLVMWAVGYDWEHVGKTIHRLLFEASTSMKVIKDKKTKAIRGFRPWDPEDIAREKDAESFPPLIPEHEIEEIVWKKQGTRIFELVRLTNGTLIYGHSSSEAKAGDPVDCIWVDEKVEHENFVAEWQARLIDKRGIFLWSTWPTSTNTALRSLSNKAASDIEEIRRGKRDANRATVVEFKFRMQDNPFLPEDEKQDQIENWRALGDVHLRARNDGEFVDEGVRVYPRFNIEVCSAIVDGEREDELSRILRKRNGEPPGDWPRDMILDPGSGRPFLLFCAVPPPHIYGNYKVVYGEIAGVNLDAYKLFAQAEPFFKEYSFRRFVIDNQAGQQKGMGYTVKVAENYSIALQSKQMKSFYTGFGFVAGSPDFAARSGIVERWLQINTQGHAELRIVADRCPVLIYQMTTNRKNVVKEVVEEKAWGGAPHDGRDCFDSKTEVLTRRGWRLFSDITLEDELATSNLDEETLEFQRPTGLIRKPYSGDMIRFKGAKLDLLVTPGHRMVVYPRFSDQAVIRRAEDLRFDDRLKMFPGEWVGQDPDTVFMDRPRFCRSHVDEVDAEDLAELLGWYISEGSSDRVPKCPGNGYRVNISQFKSAHMRKLHDLLQRLPWKWTKHEGGYSCSSKQLWSYIQETIPGRSWQKRVPQWIKDASPRIIERFVAGAVMGDGWTDGGIRRYATTCKGMAGDFQELFMKLGVTASVSEKKPRDWKIEGRTGSSRPIFIVSELVKPVAGLHRHDGTRLTSREHYDGEVFCATVPNGTLIVRRNGRAIVAGNCLEYWASTDPKWEPPVKVERKVLQNPVHQVKDFIRMMSGQDPGPRETRSRIGACGD